MASELYVETLKGLTSGANANKVIVPSGQTLDLSAGTVTGVTEGIKYIDNWRMTNTTTITGTGAAFTQGWVRNTNDLPANIGTAMTESSGVFTFPTTGMWEVNFKTTCYHGSSDSKFVGALIRYSTDSGSNFVVASIDYSSLKFISVNTWQNLYCTHIFNVSDTSTFRVRFEGETANQATYAGNNGDGYTFAWFKRLGDSQ